MNTELKNKLKEDRLLNLLESYSRNDKKIVSLEFKSIIWEKIDRNEYTSLISQRHLSIMMIQKLYRELWYDKNEDVTKFIRWFMFEQYLKENNLIARKKV